MISTHVLDTSRGLPASGITVSLERKSGDEWSAIAIRETDSDGRIKFDNPATAGTYRLEFHIAPYFQLTKTECFFPTVPVIFQITDVGRKYHVPLLLTPFGFSTYRGS